jgi:hypothetical protein
MPPKQQFRSIENKMEHLQACNPDLDLKVASRYFHDTQRYYELQVRII